MRKSIIILAGVFFLIPLVYYIRPQPAPHEKSASGPGTSSVSSADLPSPVSGSSTTEEPVEPGPRRSPRHESGELSKDRLPMIEKAIAEQELAIEEKRKALAAIVRKTGIIYDSNPAPEEPATPPQVPPQDPSNVPADIPEENKKRGQDAEAYVDAKHDFEKELSVLEVLKLRLAEEKTRQAQPSR